MNEITTLEDLTEELNSVLEFGDSMTMVYLHVQGSNEPLQVGYSEGELTIDYVIKGLLDFKYKSRFKKFCLLHNLKYVKEDWGKVKVLRAFIGNDAEIAKNLIKSCFNSVYSINREIWLKVQQYNFHPTVHE